MIGATGARQRLLVTGGSGFVGTAILHAALRSNYEVGAIARSGACVAPCLGTSMEESSLIEVLRDFRPDIVIHAVGMASVALTEADPEGSHAANVGSFAALTRAVARADIRPRVVLMSSAAVYGNPARLPVPETAPSTPISRYGRQKVACEQLASELSASSGVPTTSVRIFSLFGASQRRLLVHELFAKAQQQRAISLTGTGAETRDYLSVDGFADRMMNLLAHNLPDSGAINVASGLATSAIELAGLVQDLLGISEPITCEGKSSPHDPAHWQADISLYHRLTADEAIFDLRAALAETFRAWS